MPRKDGSFHYGDAWWRKLRKLKLVTDPLCHICGRPAEEVDHLIPIEQGGEARDWDNLASKCKACHSKKTAEDKGGKAKWGCDAQGNPLDPNAYWNQ